MERGFLEMIEVRRENGFLWRELGGRGSFFGV